ncbi:MAG: hypothetical protein AAFU81_11370, partial [Pseudomonadota bacterium]
MFWDKKDRNTVTDATIRSALGDPEWLSGVRIADTGAVTLVIEADETDMAAAERRRLDAESKTMDLDGVTEVKSVLTAQTPPTPELPTYSSTRRVRKGARLSDEALNQ